MKSRSYLYLLVLFLCCSPFAAMYAQSNIVYTDSLNKYTVKLPSDWHIELHYKQAWFLAFRPLKDSTERKVENVVLSKVYDPSVTNLQTAFDAAIASNRLRELDFKLIDTANGKSGLFKWYTETHRSKRGDETVETLIAIYFRNGAPLILTCTATTETFDRYKTTFLSIAESITYQ